MIKFFRKIRQRLLTENEFSKYLLYAFGEIILVMIGILLALQVTNWNQDRKAQEVELNYMRQLSRDIEADSIFFDSRLNGIEGQIKVLKKLKQLCDGSLSAEEGSKILDHTQNPFTRFAMESKVINDELDLKAIADEHLRDLFRQYRTRYEYITKSGLQQNTMAAENFMTMAKLNPIIHEYEPNANTLDHYKAFCDYPNIEGVIALQILVIAEFSDQIEPFMELNHTLRSEIEDYTKQKQ